MNRDEWQDEKRNEKHIQYRDKWHPDKQKGNPFGSIDVLVSTVILLSEKMQWFCLFVQSYIDLLLVTPRTQKMKNDSRPKIKKKKHLQESQGDKRDEKQPQGWETRPVQEKTCSG